MFKYLFELKKKNFVQSKKFSKTTETETVIIQVNGNEQNKSIRCEKYHSLLFNAMNVLLSATLEYHLNL